MSFSFSEEAQLFAREYSIVEAMRTAWSSDIERFFEDLHSAVEQRLRESLRDVTLLTKLTTGHPGSLYWWIPSGVPEIGNATLWYSREYPELIRDKQVHWRAYLDIKSRKASEGIQAKWVSLVDPELRKLQPDLSFTPGGADTFSPLKLLVKWREDPIEETAGLLADLLKILHQAVPKVKESQGMTP
jgi:hypothetical protein